MRRSLLLLAVAVVTIVLVVLFTWHHRKEYILLNELYHQKTTYRTILGMYQTTAEIMYEEVINRPEILRLMSEASKAPVDRQPILRGRLYRLLFPAYERLKKKNLRQLHFHFPDNTSFIRFHRLEKYGDSLTDIRESVRLVNEQHKRVSGFENGKVFNGFRFVFPLTYEEKHIGSVETSVSFRAIQEALTMAHSNHEYLFILERNKVEAKAFSSEQTIYQQVLLHPDYIVEDLRMLGLKVEPPVPNHILEINRLLGEDLQIRNNMNRRKDFSSPVNYKGTHYVVSFLPIKNIKGEQVAYIISYGKEHEIANLSKNLLFVLVGLILISGVIIFFIWKKEKSDRGLLIAQKQAEQAKQRHLEEITAKKQEMEELAERMSTIVDTAMDGIITIDTSGEVLTFNQAASAIFGYSEQEMIGQNVKRLIPEPYKSQHNIYLKQYLESGERHIIGSTRELVGKHKSGHNIPIQLAVSEVRLYGERIFTGVVHDISDRKRAETAMRQRSEALETSNRELQDFAYVASHDLQEPLRKIRAFGDRLKSRFGDNASEREQDYLDRMLNAAERMQVLISSLLSYSRVTSQAKPFEMVSLADIVTGVMSDLEAHIEETGAKVEIHDLPVLEADSLQMRQVFQNLIGNALKFQQKGVPPVIQVSSRPLDPSEGRGGLLTTLWKITIEDKGIGFDKKYGQRIFEVFERLHSRSSYEGTGIGLAICRKIVERHDGTISAQGKPGEGAVFTIVLPEHHEKKIDDDMADSTELEL